MCVVMMMRICSDTECLTLDNQMKFYVHVPGTEVEINSDTHYPQTTVKIEISLNSMTCAYLIKLPMSNRCSSS